MRTPYGIHFFLQKDATPATLQLDTSGFLHRVEDELDYPKFYVEPFRIFGSFLKGGNVNYAQQ